MTPESVNILERRKNLKRSSPFPFFCPFCCYHVEFKTKKLEFSNLNEIYLIVSVCLILLMGYIVPFSGMPEDLSSSDKILQFWFRHQLLALKLVTIVENFGLSSYNGTICFDFLESHKSQILRPNFYLPIDNWQEQTLTTT